MGDVSLSQGSIQSIASGDNPPNPIVQIIDVKKIQALNSPSASHDRYRLVISDGLCYQQAMLATQLNAKIEAGELQNQSIVQLKDYICNTVHNRRIVIILSINIISGTVGRNIGNPQSIENVLSSGQPQQPQQQQAQQPQQQSYQPQQRQAYNAGNNNPPTTGRQTVGDVQVYPIKSLNPYQNRWTIKARVTTKSDLRTWSNAKGDGKLFHVDLIDAENGEIRATAFNDAADQFYNIFQQNKVYYISKGHVKFKNKKFNPLPNDYEIQLDPSSVVEMCQDEAAIPTMHFSFVPIGSIAAMAAGDVVDIIGVVSNVGEVSSITTKAGKSVNKRPVVIVDDSQTSIELTLWGKNADNFALSPGEIFAIKSAKVSDFNNKSVSSTFQSVMETNPDRPEAHRLRGWFAERGKLIEPTPLTQTFQKSSASGQAFERKEDRKTFQQVKDELLGHDQADYFTAKGTIAIIKHDTEPWYLSCPNVENEKKCQKKVSMQGQKYVCDKCAQSFDVPDMRYVLTIMISDHTGSLWCTCFNDVAEAILGHPASQLAQWNENRNTTHQYEQVFEDATFKSLVFKFRAKAEMYNDEQRVKYSCLKVNGPEIDYVSESKRLLTQIKEYEAM